MQYMYAKRMHTAHSWAERYSCSRYRNVRRMEMLYKQYQRMVLRQSAPRHICEWMLPKRRIFLYIIEFRLQLKNFFLTLWEFDFIKITTYCVDMRIVFVAFFFFVHATAVNCCDFTHDFTQINSLMTDWKLLIYIYYFPFDQVLHQSDAI